MPTACTLPLLESNLRQLAHDQLRTVVLGGEEEPEELEAPTEELDTAVASDRLAGPPIALEAPPPGERFGDRGLFDDDEEDDQGAGTGLFDCGGGSQADQLFD